ncbi:MAG: lytic transglycosylase domain-containing protein, partial [Alphaproteobacteria bacterium]|nr:lytic transglycosylase domain-containing protein [Alphaproteobacteria bacterium]
MTLMKTLLAALAMTALAAPALAQEDIAPELQCLRYLQSYERSMQIPTGLLTAISFVEAGRPNGSDGALNAWPWTVNV